MQADRQLLDLRVESFSTSDQCPLLQRGILVPGSSPDLVNVFILKQYPEYMSLMRWSMSLAYMVNLWPNLPNLRSPDKRPLCIRSLYSFSQQ